MPFCIHKQGSRLPAFPFNHLIIFYMKTNFVTNGPISNILGFVGHLIFLTTTQLYDCNKKVYWHNGGWVCFHRAVFLITKFKLYSFLL